MRVDGEKIARIAHEGQFRRDGVTPYIVHPEAVANRFAKGVLRDTAWLHDVIEDTSLTASNLNTLGVSDEVINAVVSMTKVKGESYLDYLLKVKENPIALHVKVADITHNVSDTPTARQIEKYEMALYILRRY